MKRNMSITSTPVRFALSAVSIQDSYYLEEKSSLHSILFFKLDSVLESILSIDNRHDVVST